MVIFVWQELTLQRQVIILIMFIWSFNLLVYVTRKHFFNIFSKVLKKCFLHTIHSDIFIMYTSLITQTLQIRQVSLVISIRYYQTKRDILLANKLSFRSTVLTNKIPQMNSYENNKHGILIIQLVNIEVMVYSRKRNIIISVKQS